MALVLACPSAAIARFSSVSPRQLGPNGNEHVEVPRVGPYDRGEPMVANAGDVNGDGRDDVIAGYSDGFSAYVTFTDPSNPISVTAGSAGRGFRIVAPHLEAITGVGDVNGDGLDDVAVETRYITAQIVFVLFGRTDGKTVTADLDKLGELGDDGFLIAPGSFMPGVLGVGDQNDDGVPDVAVRTQDGVAIVYTPDDPAGQQINAASPGGGYVLTTGGDLVGYLSLPAIADMGDLNGDGRHDLAVAWEKDDLVRVVVAYAPSGPGTFDLRDVAESGAGFEASGAGVLTQIASLGDLNGDGKRELGVDMFTEYSLIYAAPAGSKIDLSNPGPGRGWRGGGGLLDVGDQNRDGVADFASDWAITFSDSSVLAGGPPLTGPEGSGYGFVGSTVAAVLGDLNGDGTPEPVVAGDGPDSAPLDQQHGYYDVFYSAVAPIASQPEPPVVSADDQTATFRASFDQPFHLGNDRTLGVEPYFLIYDPAGTEVARVGAGPIQPARSGPLVAVGTTRIKQEVSFGDVRFGAPYTYRLVVQNGRGFVTTSAERAFTLTRHGPWPPWSMPGPPRPPAKQQSRTACPSHAKTKRGTRRANRLRGTRCADRLIGLGGNDTLLGLGGADVLSGGPGKDRLSGGSGNDRLSGGPGKDRIDGGPGNDRIDSRDGVRDVVRCGSGRDSVTADERDRLIGCERVTRRKR